MSGMRQKTQNKQLFQAFAEEGRGEPLDAEYKGTEPLVAKSAPESPAVEERLMEEVCNRKNLEIAWKRVRGNKGSPGIDGMTIDAARGTCVSTGQPFGLNCLRESTNHNR